MLNLIMRLNALSCAGFGALFLLAPGAVADFLGDPPTWLLQALGAGLMLNAGHLLFEARRHPPLRHWVRYFVVLDVLWVAASIMLIAGQIFVTTPAGILATMAVAILVGGLATGQACLSKTA